MARITKAQQKALEEQRMWDATYALSAQLREEEEARRQAAAEEAAANPRGPYFDNVTGGVTSTEMTQQEAAERAASPWNHAIRRAQGDGNMDFLRSLGASTADMAGGIVDAVRPDPNHVAYADARARGDESPWALEETVQNAYDVALGMVYNQRRLSDWAGQTNILDAITNLLPFSSLAPDPSTVGAVAQTLQLDRANIGAIEGATRRALGQPSFEELRDQNVFNRGADALYGLGDSLREGRSDEAKAREQRFGEAMSGDFSDAAKYLFSPEGISGLLQDQLPASLPYMAGGMGAARGLAGLGMGAERAAIGGATVSAFAETQNNSREAEQVVLNMAPEALALTPKAQELLARGRSIEDVRGVLAREARMSAIAASVAISPATLIPALNPLENIAAGVASNPLSTTLRRTTLATLAGLGSEAAEEGGQALTSNLGQAAAGVRATEDIGEGVLAQGLVGAALGGPITGAAANIAAGQEMNARAQNLNKIADAADAITARRLAEREAAEREAAEEQVRAEGAQRSFITSGPIPVTDGTDNAGRPVESFEQYAEREGAEVTRSEEAQRQFLAQNTLESSNAALDNSLKGGARWPGNDTPLKGTKKSRAAENQRFVNQVIAEDVEQREGLEEQTQRFLKREAAEAERAKQLEEAKKLDAATAKADLKAATQRRTNARKAVLAQAQRENADKPEAERLEAIRQAGIAFDAANPVPTAQEAAAAAAAGSRGRGRPAARTQAPRATTVDPATLAAAGATPEEVTAATTAEPSAAPADREAALRARMGRASETDAEGPVASDRSAADVIRSIAERVRGGNDVKALAQEQLILRGKLDIVNSADMADITGMANADGYYDGQSMYINAGFVPEGDEQGAILNITLGHEADHAARLSGNAEVKSKVGILLGDGAKGRLISQLETSSHPVAVATRQSLADRGITRDLNEALYEDEMTAYAITNALQTQGQGVWAPIRGLVSAARRKWKDLTGSEDINLDDLGAYAQQVINAIATSEGDITSDTVGRAQIAMHGTPTTFEPEEGAPLGRFRSSAARTGEGAQAYGAGHYLTQQHGTADERYRQRLVGDGVDSVWNTAKLALDDANGDIEAARASMTQSVKDFPSLQPVLDVLNNNDADRIQLEVENQAALDRGEVYYADIPEDNELAVWGASMSEQEPAVRDAVRAVIDRVVDEHQFRYTLSDKVPFGTVYNMLSKAIDTRPRMGDRALSDMLAEAGVKGHLFSGRLDGPRNFVIYSDDDVKMVGRDQRELGQDRRSMEQFSEEIVSRPDSSASKRRQWEEDVRRGRASTVGAPVDVQKRGRNLIEKGLDSTADVLNDVFTVGGSAGIGLVDMQQDLENARNRIMQTAMTYDARLSRAFANAAAKRGVSVAELNDTILKRLDAISKIPDNARKDTLVARIAQEYPELAVLPQAIQSINTQTDRIINARLADPRPITEEELSQLEYMEANKYGYLTNVYAAFQGAAGKKFIANLKKKHAKGELAKARGQEVPASVRREYETYERALTFIQNNDVAVSDPEMLAALPLEDVEGLYDLWTDGKDDSAYAQKVKMVNEGTYHPDDYRTMLEDSVAGWASNADPKETRNLANVVLNNLLENHPLSGPAKRYGRSAGLDESILQHRQNLPKELQDLFGKITDIPSLINVTLVRQGELAETTKFLTRLSQETNEKGKPYAVSKRESSLPEYADYTVPLSGKSFGALDGRMVTPATARMITDFSNDLLMLTDALAIAGQNPSMLKKAAASKAVHVWTKLAGYQKAMSIITRPDYMLLNLAGSFATPVLTGTYTPQDFVKGLQLAAEHLAYTINPARDKEPSVELSLVLEMGLFDSAVTQEIRRTPRKMVEQVIKQMGSVNSMDDFHKLMSGLNDGRSRGWNTLVELYSMSDAWAKIPVGLARMRYLQDYYKANGDSVTNEQIMREAAKFVRDSTIGMQAVPGGVKALERLGLTFYAPYFYSAFRTLGRAPINAWNDAKMAFNAKTPEARNIAASSAAMKAAGTATVYAGFTYILKNMLQDMMDDDEREQLERDRALMFPQDAAGDLLPMGVDELGRRMYFNVSRIDQFGPATDIYRHLREKRDDESSLGIVAGGLYDLLLANRAVGWAINTAKDKDKNTRVERVFDEQTQWMKSQAARVGGNTAVQALDALIDGADLFMPAGVFNYFDPENKTPQDVNGQGRAAIAGIMAALGHRFVIVDEKRSLGTAASELRDHRKNAQKNINDTLAVLGPEAAYREVLAASDRERELVQELGRRYEAVRGNGSSQYKVRDMLTESGVDNTTITALRKQAYTSEADHWARQYSSLLTEKSLRRPPRPKESMTDAERKEWQNNWTKQAREVRRRLRLNRNTEEDED